MNLTFYVYGDRMNVKPVLRIRINDDPIEKVVGVQLRGKQWQMAAAESCTGGLLSRKITAVAGASDYFDGGFITYSNEAKTEMLKVPNNLLHEHGAVSEPVARAMAEGARKQAKVDVALAVTGIAGPTGGRRLQRPPADDMAAPA